MNILQVDMNLNLSNEAYIFVKQFISELEKIDLIDILFIIKSNYNPAKIIKYFYTKIQNTKINE